MTPMSDELTCRELVELITEYLEGTLPAGDRARFEEHLVFCPGCTYYLDQMNMTVALVGGLSEESLPPGAADAFLDVFRAWKRSKSGEQEP
jgi:anti-sigma factor RsiW